MLYPELMGWLRKPPTWGVRVYAMTTTPEAPNGAPSHEPSVPRSAAVRTPPPPPPGKRPTLFNGSTRLGFIGDLTLRHPWELPLLAVAVVISLAAYLLWIVATVFLIYLLVTGQWNSVMGPMSGAGDDPTSSLSAYSTLFQAFVIVGAVPWGIWILRALMYARLRATAVRMTPTQFPEGYRMVAEAAATFGMRRVPDAYVVSGSGVINAFAAGHGFRRFVAVHSDLFEVGGKVRDPDALRFVIAHEVGHHAAGHVGYLRLVFTNLFMQIPVLGSALSRAQEYSADNYGYAYAPEGAPGTIALLSAGKYLNAHVNVQEFADRAATERGLWLHLVNLGASHPITTWRAHALRDRTRSGRLWLRPKTRVFEAFLPAGSSWSGRYPTPEEALDLLNKAYDDGFHLDEEQFGRFPFGQSYPPPANMRELQVKAPNVLSEDPVVSRKPSRS